MMEGPGADSEEKHEPASDIDIAVVDSLKALDPKRPIREADINEPRAPGPLCAMKRHCVSRKTPPLAQGGNLFRSGDQSNLSFPASSNACARANCVARMFRST